MKGDAMRLKGWLRRSAVAGGSLAALVVAGWAALEAADRAFPPPRRKRSLEMI